MIKYSYENLNMMLVQAEHTFVGKNEKKLFEIEIIR